MPLSYYFNLTFLQNTCHTVYSYPSTSLYLYLKLSLTLVLLLFIFYSLSETASYFSLKFLRRNSPYLFLISPPISFTNLSLHVLTVPLIFLSQPPLPFLVIVPILPRDRLFPYIIHSTIHCSFFSSHHLTFSCHIGTSFALLKLHSFLLHIFRFTI